MSLSNTNQGNVPQTPFAEQNTYLPDQLIAGVFPRVTDNVTVLSGATVNTVTTLARGTVMGQITLGAATAAAAGGNTGNATCSSVTRVGTRTQVGIYVALFTAATKFDLIDPAGRKLSSGTTGVAYSDDLAFTITAGATPMIAGDSFNITVAAGSGKYIPSVVTAVDGSEAPVGILVDKADPSGGDVIASIYKTGEFNSNALTFDSGWTVTTLTAPLRALSIFLKNAVLASDPT